MTRPVLTSLSILLLSACGDGAPPTDVSGDYTLSLTNQSDSCELANFVVGQTESLVPFQVIQDDAELTGVFGGVPAAALDDALGSHVFSGDVDGTVFALDIDGTKPTTVGNCTYLVHATMDGSIDGDAIDGDITYRRADNGGSDCSALSDCLTIQRFNGTRPPRL